MHAAGRALGYTRRLVRLSRAATGLSLFAIVAACGGQEDGVDQVGVPRPDGATRDGSVGRPLGDSAPLGTDVGAEAFADAPTETAADATLAALDAGDATLEDATDDTLPEAPLDAAAAEAALDAPADVADGAEDATDAGCDDPCLEGDGKCVSGELSTCTLDTHGCTAWAPPTACGAHSICEEKLYRASCTCQPGGVPGDAGCVQVIGAPRPIAPLSTATATSQSPTLHWSLAPGTDGAEVDLCSDRACTSPVTFGAPGSSAAVPSALTAGVHYWRLRGTSGGSAGTDTSPVWEFFVGARSASADTSWGTTPDVNGDGFADVLVGLTDTSRYADVDVYLGGAGGVATTPAVIDGPTTGFGTFGVLNVTIASAGDVDGDGYSDVVVGVLSENAYSDVGAVNYYRGGPGGLGSTMTSLFSEGVPGYTEGYESVAVAPVGDVNGDGYADIITSGAYDTDAVYVLLGSATGLSTVPITITTPGPTNFGSSIAGAGDVNGDGYGDILVAAGAFYLNSGGTYLYLGGPDGPSTTPIELPSGGSALACAGDVNGDGFADIVVGSAVLFGGPNGIASMPFPLVEPPDGTDNFFGGSIASAGDVDGDGFADVLVGAESSNGGTGRAYVYRGSASGPVATPIELDGTSDFGTLVAGAGDVNGDGFADILVGAPAPYESLTSPPQGTILLYWGAATGPSSTPVLLGMFDGYTFANLEPIDVSALRPRQSI